MPKTFISREDAVDYEDVQVTVNVTASNPTLNRTILSLTLKNGYQAYLAFVGEAWDAAIDGAVTWWVEKDGAVIYQLKRSTVQIAAPEQPQNEIAPWLPLPQQATIRFAVDLTGATAGNVTARFRVYYFPIDPYSRG